MAREHEIQMYSQTTDCMTLNTKNEFASQLRSYYYIYLQQLYKRTFRDYSIFYMYGRSTCSRNSYNVDLLSISFIFLLFRCTARANNIMPRKPSERDQYWFIGTLISPISTIIQGHCIVSFLSCLRHHDCPSVH